MPDFKAKFKYSQSRKQEQFVPSKLLTRLMEPESNDWSIYDEVFSETNKTKQI
jgi:hypothetical protein